MSDNTSDNTSHGDAAHSVEISLHDDKHVSVGFYTTKDTGVYFYAGGASAAAKQQTA